MIEINFKLDLSIFFFKKIFSKFFINLFKIFSKIFSFQSLPTFDVAKMYSYFIDKQHTVGCT